MAGPNLDVKTPKFKLPAGAVDTHCHLMGPGSKYPYRPGYDDRDWEAPIEDLLRVHDAVGIDRAVIVHPYNHGTDNSVVLDAMAACSAPGSLDTGLSHAAGLIEIAVCHA